MPCAMTHRGEVLGLEQFFQSLMEYDVIFLGEVHDSSMVHEAELAVLRALAGLDPNLVLALEMFECDVQDALDTYLRGKISEDAFLERASPWPHQNAPVGRHLPRNPGTGRPKMAHSSTAKAVVSCCRDE